MRRDLFLTTMMLAAGLTATGCSKAPPAKKQTPANPAPTAKASPGGLTGKVLQAKDAAGYTYLHLAARGGQVWAAVQRARVEPGQVVTVAGAVEMKQFRSKALGRTFDSIYFGTLRDRSGRGAAALPAGHPPMPKGHGGVRGMPAGHPGGTVGGKKPGELAAAHGLVHGKPVKLERPLPRAEGGKTIAELHRQRTTLAGKQVVVRGKVVKATLGVMGRNWLHLQDGSGSPGSRDFDLTVTTTAKAKVGDVLLVKGELGVDKDFGAGYRYPVILEQATLEQR